MRLKLAWAMAILLIFTIIVNLIFGFYNILFSFVKYCRNLKICKRKQYNSDSKYKTHLREKQSNNSNRRITNQDVTKFEKDSFVEEYDD